MQMAMYIRVLLRMVSVTGVVCVNLPQLVRFTKENGVKIDHWVPV